MEADSYTDRPIVHEGETRILPGGTTISVQRQQSTPASPSSKNHIISPGETVTLPDGSTISHEVVYGNQGYTTPDKHVLRPGETRHIPGVGTVSVSRQPPVGQSPNTSSPENYVVRPGETITLPDGGTFSVQRTSASHPVQRSTESTTTIRPGETKNIPGVGVISVESSPVSPTTNGKITIRPGETIELPGGGTISVDNSPSSTQGTPGTTVIRPGETVNLPGVGRISVESSPSTPYNTQSSTTVIRPGETINLPGVGRISVQSSPTAAVGSGETIIYPGESINIPGHGVIRVETSPSNVNSSYNPSTNQFNIRPGESVVLPDGTTFSMAPRKLNYDDSQVVSTDALRPGETRHIPGVGTISVSRVSNAPEAKQDTPSPKPNETENVVSPNIRTTDQPNEKAVTPEPTVSKVELDTTLQSPESKLDADEDIPELSFAEKMKLFQSSKATNEPVKQESRSPPSVASKPAKQDTATTTTATTTTTSPKPPPVASKPIKESAKPSVSFSHKQEMDFPTPPTDMLDFELPPPPPDFIFDDFLAPPKKETVKSLEAKFSIKDQSTTNLTNVNSNQVVVTKSDPKYSITF